MDLDVIGRTLVGFYFVFFGFWNIYHWTPLIWMMSKRSIPHPYLILSFGILWQTINGFMLMAGIFVKLAAGLLIPFTIISVFIVHYFGDKHQDVQKLHLTILITNLTVTLGALLMIIAPISFG